MIDIVNVFNGSLGGLSLTSLEFISYIAGALTRTAKAIPSAFVLLCRVGGTPLKHSALHVKVLTQGQHRAEISPSTKFDCAK